MLDTQLETICGAPMLVREHAGVVDQVVDATVEPIGEGAHGGKVGQVEVCHFAVAAELARSAGTELDVADGEHHPDICAGKSPGSGHPEPVGGPGDDGPTAGEGAEILHGPRVASRRGRIVEFCPTSLTRRRAY